MALATSRSDWAWRNCSRLDRSVAEPACTARTISCEGLAFAKSRLASASSPASNPRPWLWGRVAGDVLDVATVAVTADGRKPGRLGSSFAALLGVGLLDLYCAIQSVPQQRRSRVGTNHDYSKRSGFPRGIEQMRGTGREIGEGQSGATDWACGKLGLRNAASKRR